MKLGFKKVHPDAKLPTYAHDGDAGMDVYAVENVRLLDSEPTIVSTGLIAEIPKGYELQVRSRSGLATKGVTVWNSPGTIDQGYTGVIGVILCYLSPNKDETAVKYFDIKKGALPIGKAPFLFGIEKSAYLAGSNIMAALKSMLASRRFFRISGN